MDVSSLKHPNEINFVNSMLSPKQEDKEEEDEELSDYSDDATLTYSEAEEAHGDTETQMAVYLLKHTHITGALLSSAMAYLQSWLQWEGLEWEATSWAERDEALKDWTEYYH